MGVDDLLRAAGASHGGGVSCSFCVMCVAVALVGRRGVVSL